MRSKQKTKPYYQQTVEEALSSLNSSRDGIPSTAVAEIVDKFGRNVIKVERQPLWQKLVEPFKSVFMLILGIAALVSLISNEKLDAVIIIVIIGITVIIYYVQRFSAERILRALEKHEKQTIQVVRDGKRHDIDAEDLVPGDVIELFEGQKVPADARVIHAENVRCDEAMLTGESMPVAKNSHPQTTKKQIYEQSNIIFQGSFVVSGTVSAVVVATGNLTEFGQLASLTKKTSLQSPVQKKIDKLISQIVAVVAVLAVLVFLLSFYRGLGVTESLRLVLTFSVSAVPEGLPIAISVILVLGMRRMAKYNALVRNMAAIENIGIITTIATDKTGTLTKNLLSVQDVWTLRQPSDLQQIAKLAMLSANQAEGKLHDPLDNALVEFAAQYKQAKSQKMELAKAIPFEYRFSMSGNVWKQDGKYSLYLKGAPEKIIAKCSFSKSDRLKVTTELHSLTGTGYRVIALACLKNQKHAPLSFEDLTERRFEFIGLIAIADELRPESKASVVAALDAGVSVRMITGDHFETAAAIGKQLKLVDSKDQVFDSTNMDKMSEKELDKIIDKIRVFSRVLPEYKHRILELLKKKHITAMTGDGVNDVPALASAHIGIAMGSGSQIAKEAGDIVLLDNNFKTIITAIRQGRIIFDNIRRMLFYLLSTNLGEVLTTVMALIVGLPLPLLPVQILWTNLGTDTAMVIPLGLEPGERSVMRRKPRAPKRSILGKVIVSRMVLVGFTMMCVALSVFTHFLQYESETYARTLVFSALVVMQLTNAINARTERRSIFGHFSVKNPAIYLGLITAGLLYYLAVFGPLQNILHLQSVALVDLGFVWLVAVIAITFVNEVHKFISRKFFYSTY